MAWLGAREGRLPRITHEAGVWRPARSRAAVMSAHTPACFYRWPLDRWRHCSPSGFFTVFHWGKLAEKSGAALISSRKTKRLLGPRESSLGRPPLVDTSAVCHGGLFFRGSYRTGLLDVSQWSGRWCGIIWFLSQSPALPLRLESSKMSSKQLLPIFTNIGLQLATT